MQKKSILLVDDEEIILHALGMDLKQENYDVTLATSGEQAITLMMKGQFDLVISDLLMSGLDGIQVLKEAKKINSLTGVIILTGYGDLTSAIDALRLGADDYLLKPCDTGELVFRIAQCLEKQELLKRIKLFEKILPVCIYCKKIRDDASSEPGGGMWMDMEQYLFHKSDVDVSHGCCPECFEKHKND